MSRYIGASCRLCRAEGQKLFLKGARCFTNKCSVTRRPGVPGQHGQKRKKVSEYGRQLRAKQKSKRYYSVGESQLRRYYNMATKIEGKTGEVMLGLLESRLDNIVYRLGWGESRAHSRQLLVHGYFNINSKKVNVPSYLTKVGDIISLSPRGRKSAIMKEMINSSVSRVVPKWIEFIGGEHFEAKILEKAQRVDIDLEVEETLIVELYSR
ncbi:MAG: 30S ribosomal protein S4 [Candidatus Improbicoccus devescovinae]|nr:MAG: 30S ribosomal protein S4 [Candidatus Improbicoccus devescovinae]